MSCVTCDGVGSIPPPIGGRWLSTGDAPTSCPVCCGPHIRLLLDKMDRDSQVVICSTDGCNADIRSGWLIYAQLRNPNPTTLDEEILLCCDEHVDQEMKALVAQGHPAVGLPICLDDARQEAT